MPKQLTCPAAGPVTLAVTAGYLDLAVTVDPAVTTAVIEVTGPPDVLERVTATLADGSTWQLRMPKDSPAGGFNMVGRNMTVAGDNYSTINMGRVTGRIRVNGVDITDLVNASQPAPLAARARLPQGSALAASVEAGNVAAQGALAGCQVDSVSADAEIQSARAIQARTVSGDISVECAHGPAALTSTSGDIEVEDARGAIRAETVSGDVRIHVTETVRVEARSVSGDVRVTAPARVRPQVFGHSDTGRVRLPAA